MQTIMRGSECFSSHQTTLPTQQQRHPQTFQQHALHATDALEISNRFEALAGMETNDN